METKDCRRRYQTWCERVQDADLAAELTDMRDDPERIEDAFYRDLTFGTAGLRGIMGAGTNRMNVYTVAKATQGLANYLQGNGEAPSVTISYDSRLHSEDFAKVVAAVLAANGVMVKLWPELMPVPVLSYAIRALGTSAGVMITASHNPSSYNGYKVYGPDGCQITTGASEAILFEIERLDIFSDVKKVDFEQAIAAGQIRWVEEAVYEAYIREVLQRSVLYGDLADREAVIVYSPLNGAGRKPVLRVLEEAGYAKVTVVKEQEKPDGHFSTCPKPNPETPEAMALGLDYARRLEADIVLATDPDADRVGVALREGDGYRLLTGNEVGILLLDYICAQRTKHERMPEDPLMIRSIVSSALSDAVAQSYGVRPLHVLTGFKYIGEKIGELEKAGQAERYIFGYEESCGYLSGTHARDKDAVNAVLLIAEMYCRQRAQGRSLWQRLEEIYARLGYRRDRVHAYDFPGVSGFEVMREIMQRLRSGLTAIAGYTIVQCRDFAQGVEGLPRTDMLKFTLEDGSTLIVRPSGTEPKIKIYTSVCGAKAAEARRLEQELLADVESIIESI